MRGIIVPKKRLSASTSLAGLLICFSMQADATLYHAHAITQVNAGFGFCIPGDPVSCTDGQNLTGNSPVTATSALLPFFNAASVTATSGPVSVSSTTWDRAGTSGSAFARSIADLTREDLVSTKLPGYAALPDILDVTFRVLLDFDVTHTDPLDTDTDLYIRHGIGPILSNFHFTDSANTVLSVSKTVSVGSLFDLELKTDVDGGVTRNNVTRNLTAGLFFNNVLELPEGYTLNGDIVVNNRIAQSVPEPGIVWLLLLGLAGFATVQRVFRPAHHESP